MRIFLPQEGSAAVCGEEGGGKEDSLSLERAGRSSILSVPVSGSLSAMGTSRGVRRGSLFRRARRDKRFGEHPSLSGERGGAVGETPDQTRSSPEIEGKEECLGSAASHGAYVLPHSPSLERKEGKEI